MFLCKNKENYPLNSAFTPSYLERRVTDFEIAANEFDTRTTRNFKTVTQAIPKFITNSGTRKFTLRCISNFG